MLSIGPAPVHGQDTGTIDGRLELRRTPPRRVVNRYPGAGPGAAHPVQSLPAVVYIAGKVAGAPAHPPTRSPTMAQHDTAFVPGMLVVPVGTVVTFPNQDPFFHNVFSY
ncbi:MAG TPA: hypothetical protein VJ957_03320, partial [Longimicrobiales bacterium]|nr:hypothetical protein [Longimicrobiales bacterium]